jgi:uncharacterized protein (UPF0332 family)
MPPEYTPQDLSAYRLRQARECLRGAERELIADSFENSANRSYYSIFNAMRAVLALDRFDSRKHSGVISAFHKNYIRPRIFPVEFSNVIDNAFEVRISSDYHEFYVVSKEKVVAQLENAKKFLSAVEKHIGERIKIP